jgi:biopolymer transport protein ExbB
LAIFVVFSLAMISGFSALAGQSAYAQNQGAPASAGDTAGKAEDVLSAGPSLFRHLMRSAGFFFGPLMLIISIGLVALVVLLSMDLRMTVAIPPSFVEEFTETVNKRQLQEAYDLTKNDTSFLGRVLYAGMGRLRYGLEDARETAFHAVESAKATKEQLITYLATIGTLGPMLGLVGTVLGMIMSFMELSQPGKTPNAQKLADGISHALVITLLGIALAVPAIFFHAFFRNRLIRISMDAASVADDLLTQMYHNSRSADKGRATAAAATARPAEG